MLRHLEPAPVKPRRVVVVGAAGFVGVAVCRQLVAAGVETLPVTRSECDLLKPDAIERLTSLLRDGDAIVAACGLLIGLPRKPIHLRHLKSHSKEPLPILPRHPWRGYITVGTRD